MNAYILTLSCRNRPGIVATMANHLAEGNGDIVEAQQFDDEITGRFFMRVSFVHSAAESDLRHHFKAVAAPFGMNWELHNWNRKPKVLLLVSKFDHCLGDLLYRQRLGELKMDVVAVASNHPRDVLNLTVNERIPHHHLPITKDTKPRCRLNITKMNTPFQFAHKITS